MASRRLQIPVLLSIAAAVVTIGLKGGAYLLTGSVGLLSDAAESLVNLVAAVTAYVSLWYAAKPVDASHTYGHEKIEFFSSGLEGVLIVVAAVGIAVFAVQRIVRPEPLGGLGAGLAILLVAALINGAVAALLLRAGRAHGSIILEADGRHLLADVWTSVGVLAGLGVVALTGWQVLDSLIALVVAGNILWTGGDLIRRSFHGLMDHALPRAEQDAVKSAIEANLGPDMAYHALRTRQAGSRRFADFHLLVPGSCSVKKAHELTVRIEDAMQAALPGLEVTVHVEPIEEPRSWEDSALLAVEEEERARRRGGNEDRGSRIEDRG
jgi:cation diffusion facilitator family transporter